MIPKPFLAGAMLASMSFPASAQETGETATNSIPQISAEAMETSDGVNAEARSEQVANMSLAAQQFGNLATTKATDSLVGDLGDVVVLLHTQVIEHMQPRGTMKEEDQQRLEELSLLNEAEFAKGFAGWIAATYPSLIDQWQGISHRQNSGRFATTVTEQLRAQLEVARKIIAADGNLISSDGQVRETLAWGGAQDEGRVAEQFHLKREDPAAEENDGD